eukprot:332723_1
MSEEGWYNTNSNHTKQAINNHINDINQPHQSMSQFVTARQAIDALNTIESIWISRYHLVNIPCLNVLSLGGKQNMDETTTWASETTHFYTKKLDIPTQFRCDIFVSKKVELALELNKLLLFEVNRNEMKKIKKTKMTNSQWSRGKMKGKSKKGDKQLLERYKSLMEYID